ncbi:MAG: biotin--[acetyl-CoA-carboxylase] ligase [Gammaproteobacteria bacterium]|nr:biotin--[acetyl-CoA-carboxylase] ligase [Gammaproteobacteria bacterium]
MPSHTEILRLLADSRFHSGSELGRALGVGRGAVHNAVHRLIGEGLEIFSVRGRGYRLATPVEVLDGERIRAGLPPAVVGQLRELEVLEEVDSTNSALLRRGRGAAPAACLTEWQSAGRGRRGRNWAASPWRNLMLSVSWELEAGANQIGGLSLAAGVAVARVLEAAGIRDVRLKWPNDVLWRQRKLGGILVDLAGVLGDPCLVVVGVGLNLALEPGDAAEIAQPWVDVREVAGESALSRNRLAAALVAELLQSLEIFARQGFAPFREPWLERHAMQGEEVVITADGAGDALSGTAVGIDPVGALVLRDATGRQHRVLSGELSLRRG